MKLPTWTSTEQRASTEPGLTSLGHEFYMYTVSSNLRGMGLFLLPCNGQGHQNSCRGGRAGGGAATAARVLVQ